MSGSLVENSLGSLAQSARTKQLKTVRGILYFVGIVTVIVNLALVIFADKWVDMSIEEELKGLRDQHMIIDQAKLAEFKEQAVRSTRLVNGVAVIIGAVFIGCATMVYTYPVPATVISLVLYLGSAAVYGVLDPTTLARGWILKILIVVALFKAVQAALAYESERKADTATPVPADGPRFTI